MADNSASGPSVQQSGPPGTITPEAIAEELGPFGKAAMRAAEGFKDDISASACKEPRTNDQVSQDFIELFQHLSLDAQQSLRDSPAKILTVGPQVLGLHGGAGSPLSSGTSGQGDGSGAEQSNNEELDVFPHNPMVFEQALGHAVPVEILHAIGQYLPPIDEILLSHTHPNIFNSDRFSFYQLDCEYQYGWQTDNPACEEERLPLLLWAINIGAPPTVIRNIAATWRKNDMDLDLKWTLTSNKIRTMNSFVTPMAAALKNGRLNIVKVLQECGASIRGLGSLAMNCAIDPDCLERFSDATWRGMEDLILDMYHRNQLFKFAQPDMPWGIDICDRCVAVGWLRLLRLYINDWTIANMDPNKDWNEVRNSMILRRHRHLANRMNTWLDLVGRYRSDNTAMIDYIAEVLINSQRNTKDWDPLPHIFWHGLQDVMIQGIPSEKKLSGGNPRPIHRNAVHIIRKFLPDFPNMIPIVSNPGILLKCMQSEDNLPLLQTIFPAIVGPHRRTPKAVAKMAEILRRAVGSHTGVPRTVAWLLQQEGMMAARYVQYNHVLSYLSFCRDAAGVRANLATLMPAYMDVNDVLYGWHHMAQQADIFPIDLVHEFDVPLVEFVALGNVNIGYASPWTRERARDRLQQRQDLMEIKTMSRSLAEVMRCASLSYEVRRRIVDLCIVNNIGTLPPVMSNV